MLEPSLKSFYIEMHSENACIASATAFAVKYKDKKVLLTNRHNVTGRNNDTNEMLGPTTPVTLNATFPLNKLSETGEIQWKVVNLQLYDNAKPNWIEHPVLGSKADFVGLPLTDLFPEVEILSYEISELDPVSISFRHSPSDRLNIIGFPFGTKIGGSLPIWATGFIASEPLFNFRDLPLFLIDIRARKGQSGSPVISYLRPFENIVDNGGKTISFNTPIIELMGIYSGRINSESDLGIVWKSEAILELVKSIS